MFYALTGSLGILLLQILKFTTISIIHSKCISSLQKQLSEQYIYIYNIIKFNKIK